MRVFGIETDGEIRYHLAESLTEAVNTDFSHFLVENDDWIKKDGLSATQARDYYNSIFDQAIMVAEIYEANP